MMQVLTNFADQAVVLPLTLVLAVALWAAGWRRGAAVWTLAVLATLALTVALKIALYAGGPLAGLQSPSGHTAAGTVVYGGLLVLTLARPVAPMIAALPAAAIAVLFGVTRLLPGVHTPADVLVGGGFGVAGVVLLAWLSGPRPAALPRARLLLAAVVVACALHGQQLHAEGLLRAIAASIERH
ncbi:MAG TPA: phosphatase PAP2 family protein [Roseomonas sp.]|jgi:membrane-associated phospholipid phosphatase